MNKPGTTVGGNATNPAGPGVNAKAPGIELPWWAQRGSEGASSLGDMAIAGSPYGIAAQILGNILGSVGGAVLGNQAADEELDSMKRRNRIAEVGKYGQLKAQQASNRLQQDINPAFNTGLGNRLLPQRPYNPEQFQGGQVW